MPNNPKKPDLPCEDAFWIGAKSFLEAADAAHEKMKGGNYAGMLIYPTLFLYFRAIELGLKSLIRVHCTSETELTKTLGHRLTPLLDRAEELGVFRKIGMSRSHFVTIDSFSDEYANKWFEYSPDFWTRRPDQQEIATLTEAFVEAARHYSV